MWGKEVSATLVRKENKKRKKKTYLYLLARECKQWRRGDLGGLRGKARWWGLCVERRGFEDPARGVKRVSVTLVRKGTKKKKEKKKKKELGGRGGGGGGGRGGARGGGG